MVSTSVSLSYNLLADIKEYEQEVKESSTSKAMVRLMKIGLGQEKVRLAEHRKRLE